MTYLFINNIYDLAIKQHVPLQVALQVTFEGVKLKSLEVGYVWYWDPFALNCTSSNNYSDFTTRFWSSTMSYKRLEILQPGKWAETENDFKIFGYWLDTYGQVEIKDRNKRVTVRVWSSIWTGTVDNHEYHSYSYYITNVAWQGKHVYEIEQQRCFARRSN